MVKRAKKTVQKMEFSQDIQLLSFIYILQFFAIIPPKLDFDKNKQNSEHLDVLWRIFFGFQSFYVYFGLY